MLHSSQRRAIFVHNQKAAGTSIGTFLRRHVADITPVLPEHALAEDGIARLGAPEWNRCYSFGFVRNPWARLVSWHRMIMERPEAGRGNPWWFYVRARGATFEEFVLRCTDEVKEDCGGFLYRRSAVRNQLDYFTDADGRQAVSFIGRFERLGEDFATVQRALDLPAEPLTKLNATSGADYRACYNERTRTLVAERFARDIARFGYTFDNGFVETG